MSSRNKVRALVLPLVAGAFIVPLMAQQRSSVPAHALTTADYARAEHFMSWNTTPLVYRNGVSPTWIADDRFWYRVTTPAGNGTVLVDPKTGVTEPCTLPACTATPGGRIRSRRWARPRRAWRGGGDHVDITGWLASGVHPRLESVGPRRRDRQGTPLTTDGVKDFGYATDNAGWAKSDRPIVVWSPDSKKIATFQQDQRNVGEMYLVSTAVGHPQLQAWKYPLPGDDDVSMIQRVVIDVDAQKVVRLKMAPDQHRSSLCDNLTCRGSDWGDVQWAPDSRIGRVRLDLARSQARVLRIADPATGDVRDVLDETVEDILRIRQRRASTGGICRPRTK